MSSTFSSTRAEYGSISSHNSGPQSRSATVSERSTSASKHSRTSKHSSRGSSRKPTASVSSSSDASSSKPNSRTSSIHSSKPSRQQEQRLTLAEIRNKVQANGELQQKKPPVNENPFAYPVRSNIHNVRTTASMIEAEYKVRIQVLLGDLEPLLDVDGESADTSDTPIDVYDSRLELDE